MFSFQPMLKQNWTSIVVWRVGSMGPPTRDIIRSPKGSLPVYQRLTLSPNFQQFSLTLYFTFSLVSVRYNGTIRVLSRIYHLGEKSWVAAGDNPPSPDEVWCTLRHNFEKCYSVCTNLVALLIYCNNNNVFFWGGGKLGILGGGSFYPSNTLDKTLTIVNPNHFRPRSGSWKDPISPPYS